MKSGIPIKKLYKTAVYTSLILIAVLAITPHTVVFRTFSINGMLNGIIFLSVFVFCIWIINISLIYLSERYEQLKRRTYLRYLLSFILCIPCILLVKAIIKSFFYHEGRAPAHLFAIFVLGFILNSIVLIIQELILLREKKSRIELENAALKIKNIEATNQQLKHQIHPHFLFNSLNTLKTLINKNPEQAEDYLVKLSDFLRASLLSGTPNVVKLSEEIKLCNDFLEMQKMRFGNALTSHIDVSAEIQNSVYVPVFSILPLLENSIKHNQLTNEIPLRIEVRYESGRIVTSNNMQPKTHNEPSTGLGLDNLSERYRILSGDEVIVTNDGNTFSVSIKTLNDESSNNRG
jgi:two-component system, LytTR family, sensor kinase